MIASHRSLVVECEGVEVSEHGFSKQGNHIAFFVFTDLILVLDLLNFLLPQP